MGRNQIYKFTDFLAFFLRSLDSSDTGGADATIPFVQRVFNHVQTEQPNHGSLGTSYLTKWVLLDIITIALIHRLRVPGLLQGRFKAFLYTGLLLLANATLFGQLNLANMMLMTIAWTWNRK
jgi:hypothetical protein